MTESQLESQNQAKLHPALFTTQRTADLKGMFPAGRQTDASRRKEKKAHLSSVVKEGRTDSLWVLYSST